MNDMLIAQATTPPPQNSEEAEAMRFSACMQSADALGNQSTAQYITGVGATVGGFVLIPFTMGGATVSVLGGIGLILNATNDKSKEEELRERCMSGDYGQQE
jgi:hypothetical protein